MDRAVLLGAAVVGRSLLYHLPEGSHVRIFLIHSGLSEREIERLRASWMTPGLEVEVVFQELREERFQHLLRSKSISHMAYGLLLLGDLLPPEVSRCLYLDTDCIVEKDFTPLFNMPLGDQLAAAVDDGGKAFNDAQCRRLGIESHGYLNSGVVLADLVLWRKERLGEKALQFCADERPPFHDQDALNWALRGRWVKVESRWNTWASRLTGDASHFRGIIHCTGVPKPWHVDYEGPVRGLFFSHLDRTAFSNFRPRRFGGVMPVLARLKRKIPYLPTVLRMARDSMARALSLRSPRRP